MEEAGGAAEAVDGILETYRATLPQRLEALVQRRVPPMPTAAAGGACVKVGCGTIGAGHLAALLEETERCRAGGDLAGARDKLEHIRGGGGDRCSTIFETATKGGADA